MDESITGKNKIKPYEGRIPACGVFCGGCPVYIRERKPCPGAETNRARCDNCRSYHLCCIQHGVTHCWQCPSFPCRRLRDFAGRWLKYGQDLLENQRLLARMGESGFLKYYNSRTEKI